MQSILCSLGELSLAPAQLAQRSKQCAKQEVGTAGQCGAPGIASVSQGVLVRVFMLQGSCLCLVWKSVACLTKPEFIPVILPCISMARLEQPVEKIPVYFQK